MSDCPRVGRLFGGCKFSPRYDTVPPSPAQITAAFAIIAPEVNALTAKRYLCDVCERCGKTLFRRKPSTSK